MAEENGAADPEAQGAAQPAMQVPRMQILGQFVRDMSFENVAAQKRLSNQVQPDIQVRVALDAKKRDADNQYDVIVKLTVESKVKDSQDTLFLMELDYAGIFQIDNVQKEQLHPFLMIECPRMLFPFLRRIVSDVTRDGGYPPLNLETIDWLQIYKNEIQRRAETQKTVGTA